VILTSWTLTMGTSLPGAAKRMPYVESRSRMGGEQCHS